jgi:hypothetical protein
MKNIVILLSFVLIMIVSNGCTLEKKVDVQVSPTFKSGNYILRGVEGRIGILAPGGFKSNAPNKYMWHFLGNKRRIS